MEFKLAGSKYVGRLVISQGTVEIFIMAKCMSFNALVAFSALTLLVRRQEGHSGL